MAERIQVKVKLVKEISWSQACYAGYGHETVRRYILKSEDGTTYTWKTTSVLYIGNDDDGYRNPSEGSVITIKASIKGESEYNGKEQIELTRVKLVSIDEMALTKEQREEIKRKEQIESLGEHDSIWKQMPYKQYKEHYSDCETLAGSFVSDKYGSFIDVIIREGRLKNSGVRGEHFSGYCFENENGEHATYRAVNLENALKQVRKEFPEDNWKCVKIYSHRRAEYRW